MCLRSHTSPILIEYIRGAERLDVSKNETGVNKDPSSVIRR